MLTLISAPHVAAGGDGQFLGVDWGLFVIVFLVSFAAAVVIVVFYSLGLRLLATGSADDDGTEGSVAIHPRGDRPLGATVGGFVCLAIGIAAVLYGLYLVIPQFH